MLFKVGWAYDPHSILFQTYGRVTDGSSPFWVTFTYRRGSQQYKHLPTLLDGHHGDTYRVRTLRKYIFYSTDITVASYFYICGYSLWISIHAQLSTLPPSWLCFFININELVIEEKLSTLIVRRKNLYCGKLKKRPGGGADTIPRHVKKTTHKIHNGDTRICCR